MKLAVIVTSTMIKEKKCPRDRGFHMALGQHLGESSYREYFRILERHGCHVIVDNGAAEKDEPDVDFKDIVRWAKYIDADEIVLPDKLNDAQWTIEATMASYHLVPVEKRMIVPQGKTKDEWQKCYEMMAGRFRFRSVGIPKVCEDFPGGRPSLVKWLRTNPVIGYNIEIHFLGVHKQPVEEVYQAALADVRSIDTAAPVAYAQRCRQVNNEQPRISLDWNANFVDEYWLNVNINALEEVIQNAHNFRRSQRTQGNRVS